MGMTSLRDSVVLEKDFEYITMMDLRKRPGEIFDSVAFGKTFVVTKQGKPVAVLSKLPGETLTIEVGRDGKISYCR